MKFFHLIILPVFLGMSAAALHAETTPSKSPSLEEMSAAELKEALKQSHSEIESRLGSGGSQQDLPEQGLSAQEKTSSLSEKRSYETSAQSQIDLLNYKIQTLEFARNKNRAYAMADAYKLKSIQTKAREQLIKIRADNTNGWKTNKQMLDSLLRDAANIRS